MLPPQPRRTDLMGALRFLDEIRALSAQPKGLRHAASVVRVGESTVRNVALEDFPRRPRHCPRRILKKQLLLSRCHQPEQVARLLPVSIVDAVIPVVRGAFERQWGF
jgi:hypothetical protein